jgi:hypothetical protein
MQFSSPEMAVEYKHRLEDLQTKIKRKNMAKSSKGKDFGASTMGGTQDSFMAVPTKLPALHMEAVSNLARFMK